MSDEKPFGAIAIAVGADPEKRIVIIGFTTKVDRIEFSPEQAQEFAKTLIGRSLIASGVVPPNLEAAIKAPRQTILRKGEIRDGDGCGS